MSKTNSVFTTLNKIDVSDKTEKKGNLTYLSWAWAWGELLKNYPDATYQIIKNNEGVNYHHDNKTAWVETEVTINGKTLPEQLPIMDFRNNSIPLEKITSFEVNKAVKRCVTKNIALHGLGLYIYAGEDLPEGVEPVKEKPKNIDLVVGDDNWEKALKFVVDNKDKGLYWIVERLETKYSITKQTFKKIESHVK
tara:strand:- start:609 stop:1190 length:582 start_codon:yes stop_codon:yes gene_type:complete